MIGRDELEDAVTRFSPVPIEDCAAAAGMELDALMKVAGSMAAVAGEDILEAIPEHREWLAQRGINPEDFEVPAEVQKLVELMILKMKKALHVGVMSGLMIGGIAVAEHGRRPGTDYLDNREG